MSYKITVHTEGLAAVKARLKENCTAAANTLASEIMKDTRPFVPMKNGVLDARTYVDGDMVVYPGPYARFLYYGKVMIDPETGSTYARKGATKVVTDRDLAFSHDGHALATSHWIAASEVENGEKWERIAGKLVTDGLRK